MTTTVERIRADKRVEHLDFCDDGPIVTLKRGWSFDPLFDNRVLGEDTVTEIWRAISKHAKRYSGPFDP
jgi:hypothetical protein